MPRRGATNEESWYAIWDLLFPAEERPANPYSAKSYDSQDSEDASVRQDEEATKSGMLRFGAQLEMILFGTSQLLRRLTPPADKKHVKWNCQCGYEIHDDFTELVPGGVERYRKQLELTAQLRKDHKGRGKTTQSSKDRDGSSNRRNMLSQSEPIPALMLGSSNLSYSIPVTMIMKSFLKHRMGIEMDVPLCFPLTLGIWLMYKSIMTMSQTGTSLVYTYILSLSILSVLNATHSFYLFREDLDLKSVAWVQHIRPQYQETASWFMPTVLYLLGCCSLFLWLQMISGFIHAINEFRKHSQWTRKVNLMSDPTTNELQVDLESQHDSSSTGPFIRSAIHANQTTSPPLDLEFLLLCYSSNRYAKRLLQFDLFEFQVTSDRQLFELLRANCMSLNSSRFSWRYLRKLSWIKFVFFEMYKSELVDVRKEDDMPPQESIDREEYKYAPAPPEIMPPVGYEHMMHLFYNPECADDEPLCLERFPKKMKEKLLCMRGRKEGWGLQFVEKWDWLKIWIIMFLVFGLGSLLFGVLWSRYRTGIQDGFSVAQYMIGFAAIAICGLQSILVG